MGQRFYSGTGSILINRSGARISIDDGTNSFVTANYDSLCKTLVQLIRDNSGLSEAGHGNPYARVGDVIGAGDGWAEETLSYGSGVVTLQSFQM